MKKLLLTLYVLLISAVSFGSPGPSLIARLGGTAVFTQCAFYDNSGAGSTFTASLIDGFNNQVVFTDTNGGTFGTVTVSVPASTGVGLGWEFTQTKPGGTYYLKAFTSSNPYTLTITVKTGSLTYNTSGTSDSTVGAGNGILSGQVAPGAGDFPMTAGNTYRIVNGIPTLVTILNANAANTLYGGPPTTSALGGKFAPARPPTDVFGALSGGWGGINYGATLQPPAYWKASNDYYVNQCTSQTISSWNSGTGVITTAANHGLTVGMPVVILTLSATGANIGTYTVVTVPSATTFTCNSPTPSAFTSGTCYGSPNGFGPGNDSNTATQAQSPSTPWATISHAQAGISTNGDANIWMADGTYYENTSSASRFTPNVTFINPVVFRSYSQNRTRVTITTSAANASNGVVNVRGTSAFNYYFQDLTIAPNGTGNPDFYWNPSSSAVTGSHFHFYNVLFQEPSASSSVVSLQFGATLAQVAVTGIAFDSGTGLIKLSTANTAPLTAGCTVYIRPADVTGSYTGQISGYWAVANIVSNTSFELAGSSAYTGSPSVANYSWQGTDWGCSDVQCVGCTWQTTGSSTYGQTILGVQPLTDSGTNQPFSNFGFWNCNTATPTAANTHTIQDWSIHTSGLNGLAVVGNNILSDLNHAFLVGIDSSSAGQGGNLGVAQCTNVYVGCNAFDSGASASNGHGAEIGENVQSAIFEYNFVHGTLQGVVIKGAQNTVVRRITVKMDRSSALNGLYPKGSSGTQVLFDDLYGKVSDCGFRADYDGATSPTDPDSNSILQGNWLIADGASASLFVWAPSPRSSGYGVADYNVYDLRNGAAWGTLRSRTPSSLATLQSGWTTYGITGDLATNDAHSQVNVSGATGTRNDTVWVGGSSNTGLNIYAEYVYQDGRRFNGLALESYNSTYEQRYAFAMFESTTTGTYSRPLPFNMPAGYWTVVERKQLGAMPSASDPIVNQIAIAYAS